MSNNLKLECVRKPAPDFATTIGKIYDGHVYYTPSTTYFNPSGGRKIYQITNDCGRKIFVYDGELIDVTLLLERENKINNILEI
jgi:hypothetical protein